MADLREILDEYDLKRSRSTQQFDSRLARFYREYPEIQRLLEERSAVFLSSMKEMIENNGQKEAIVARVKTQDQAIEEKIRGILQEKGIRIPEQEYECPICRDTGYIETETGRRFCACLEKRIFLELYHGRDLETLSHSFAQFDEQIYGKDGAEQKKLSIKIRNFLMKYAEDFPRNDRRTIVLTGQPGLGKTFFLESLASEMKNKTESILFINAFDLFSSFHKYRLGELETIEPIMNVQALFIDDLGSEQMTQNVTKEYMFQMIERRQTGGLHTFLATNLDEGSVKDRYTEKVASRLFAKDMTLVFRFKGSDLRI